MPPPNAAAELIAFWIEVNAAPCAVVGATVHCDIVVMPVEIMVMLL